MTTHRRRALAGSAGVALLIPLSLSLDQPGAAQALQRLHVRTFTLSADRYAPRVAQQLHLTLYLHVDELVGRLDNVALPDLAGFDVYGDERHCAPARRGGTDCGEVLLVAPKETGTFKLGPATLDAVDARNGKPSRFASNTIALAVGADPMQPIEEAGGVIRAVLRLIVLLFGVAAAVGVAVWAFRRRPTIERTPLAPAIVPPPSRESAEARWRALVAALAAQPTRPRVVAVRDELRRRVGARDEETLGDLVARGAAGSDHEMYAALRAVERAAFIEDERLVEAVNAAVPPLERLSPQPDPARANA